MANRTMHRFIATIGFLFKYPGLIPQYRRFQKTEWFPYDRLKKRQEHQLVKLITFAYENVPYYRKLFNRIGLVPDDMRKIEDLEKLPVLNKRIIKENWEDFIPGNLAALKFINRTTSGSTGMPFQYRISLCDWENSLALIFRGRGYAGFTLGDKLAIVSSQSPSTKSTLYGKLSEFILHQQTYSYSNVTKERSMQYFSDLNRFKPKYILSSPLSLSLFANFIQDNNLSITFRPAAIFTNGEKLFDNQRSAIEKVMGAKVFDFYGLDDGGISANECEHHRGLHIDMERGILEVVNAEGAQLVNEKGRILATSLYNFAMPFIRYETGDLGTVTDQPCVCGRKTRLLQEIAGRIEGYITTPSGVNIHGAIFASYLSHMGNVNQFQVVQNTIDEVLIKIVPENCRKKEDINIDEMRKVIAQNDEDLKVNVQIVSEEALEYTKAGKYKFVINNVKQE